MTKEEAHKILCRNILPCLIGEWREAISIATKALEAEPQWIPVTERLPEGIGRVIAQMDGGAIHDVFYKGKNPYGHVVWVRLDDCIYWDNEVVAWMPLPEPYKGVTE